MPVPLLPVIADVDIDTLPRRRTDNARILDRSKYTVKLYTTDGGVKLLRRKDGRVERQHRLSVGSLPVAYTGDGGDDILYVMDRAVTSYNRDAGGWVRYNGLGGARCAGQGVSHADSYAFFAAPVDMRSEAHQRHKQKHEEATGAGCGCITCWIVTSSKSAGGSYNRECNRLQQLWPP